MIKLQCVIYQWIRLNELYKLIEAFVKFQIGFRNFGHEPNYIQKNSEAWILIKLQCVIYQWNRLDKLYKLMESFFQISIPFIIIVSKTKKYTYWRRKFVLFISLCKQRLHPLAFLAVARGTPDHLPGDFCHHNCWNTGRQKKKFSL